MSEGTREVVINREPVELYKILKFEGLADNGGEAKALIEQGLVSVNGEVETRKRRKIVSSDVIEFGGLSLRVVRDEAAAEREIMVAKPSAVKKRPRLDGRAGR